MLVTFNTAKSKKKNIKTNVLWGQVSIVWNLQDFVNFLLVSSQVAPERKCFVADITDFWLYTLMNSQDVTLQVTGTQISLVTLWARIRPLTAV